MRPDLAPGQVPTHGKSARRANRLVALALVSLACAPLLANVLAASFDDARRATMQVVFESIHELLSVDISEGGLDDPRNQARILTALRELDDQASILASHGFPEDTGGIFLAGALERYATSMLRSYERGSPERLRWLLYRVTDICIACHTRLPSPGDSPVAREFVDSAALASLALPQKAKLQVATRRFDDGLFTLEQIIARPGTSSAELVDALTTYLIVSMRVKQDLERPLPTLRDLARRADVSESLRRDVGAWIESLERLRARPPQGAPLEVARTLVREAESAAYPSEGSALVNYVAVSALLRRYLEGHPPPSASTAEAHFLLGLAEYRMRRDDWLPQAELFLESAILAAPGAPWARQAFALLESKVRRAYATMPQATLPADVAAHLDRLRQMVE